MGIESFNHVKPSVANGDNVKLLYQAYGDPLTIISPAQAPGDNIQPAGLFSTAPYKPPRAPERDRKCQALGDTCNAWATKRYPGLCYYHGQGR